MRFLTRIAAIVEDFYDPRQSKVKFMFHIMLTIALLMIMIFMLQVNHKSEQVKQDYQQSKQFKNNEKIVESNHKEAEGLKKKIDSGKANDSEKHEYAKIKVSDDPDLTDTEPSESIMGILDKIDNAGRNDEAIFKKLNNTIVIPAGETKWLYENWLAKSFDLEGNVGFDPYSSTLFVGIDLSDMNKGIFKKRAELLYNSSELSARTDGLKITWKDEMH